MSSKTKGRPPGSPNVKTTADAVPSACPYCQSTRRGPYLSRRVQEYAGEMNGRTYTHILRRRVQCEDCRRIRIDRSFEHWPDGDPEE